MTTRVVVLDVGAVSNLGWAALDIDDARGQLRQIEGRNHDPGTGPPVDRGTGLDDLVSCVADALEQDIPVALGFECPVFVPVRRNTRKLLEQRCGENGAPFAAGAGALALVVGLVESAWVLGRLGEWGRSATVDPALWPDDHPVLLWEAFVHREGKVGEDSESLPDGWLRPEDGKHVRDAATAVAGFFRNGTPSLASSDIDSCGEPAFNTLAAAAMRSSMLTDVRELSRRSYVVKAR
jgi:hypothetical protein